MTTPDRAAAPLSFQAIPEDGLRRVRAAGVDDFGHDVRMFVNETDPGTPLRCCLREAAVGERVALISWRPLVDAPDSVYAEVGPVFVHYESCPGYRDDGTYPEGFRHREQVLRSYTATGDMHATTITSGRSAETAIRAQLADPAAAVVHSRNVQAGCFMFAVRRG